MTNDRRVPNGAILVCVFAAGFLFRFLPLAIWPSIAHPDEVFQAMEQGHRLAYGYGLVPWEFGYDARSWLLAYMSAGAMSFSNLFGGTPQIYLPMVAALFSLLGAASTACSFLWGRRFYGLYGGLAAALVSASWVDNMYFGGRSLTEAVAAPVFVIAIYLAEPGFRVEHRGRLLLAGLFAGASLVLRIQLAPAIALLWLWRATDLRRFVFLSLGALAAFALDGAFDAVTVAYPFEPVWRNIVFNLAHSSGIFGTKPWWEYFYWMGANWGGTIAVFFPLVFLGARRVPFVVAAGFVIVLVHSVIGHKEYRFIYPAILLFSVAAGLGIVEAARLISHGFADDGRTEARTGVAAALGAAWALLAIVNYVGRDYESDWDRAHHSAMASLYISKLKAVCGIGIYRVGNFETGGYTYLHQRVPLFWANNDSEKVLRSAASFNVLLDGGDTGKDLTIAGEPRYKALACFKDVCVLRRPGACEKVTLPKPRPAELGVMDGYPYIEGVQ